jgi:hypothetical protein
LNPSQIDGAENLHTGYESDPKHLRNGSSSNDPLEELHVEQTSRSPWCSDSSERIAAKVKFEDGIEASSPQVKAAA